MKPAVSACLCAAKPQSISLKVHLGANLNADANFVTEATFMEIKCKY